MQIEVNESNNAFGKPTVYSKYVHQNVPTGKNRILKTQ